MVSNGANKLKLKNKLQNENLNVHPNNKVSIAVESREVLLDPSLFLHFFFFVIIIIITICFITVFAGVLFVHQPDADHAPRASVTQVNNSVHTLSTFLRIRADPSMHIV